MQLDDPTLCRIVGSLYLGLQVRNEQLLQHLAQKDEELARLQKERDEALTMLQSFRHDPERT